MIRSAFKNIAHLSQHRRKLVPAGSYCHCFIQCLAHQIEAGGLTVLFGKVDRTRRFVLLRILYHRQSVFLADTVRHGAELIINAVFGLQLFSVPHPDGVHNEVIVVGSRIEVRCHKYLIIVAPEPTRCFQADLMAFRCRYLTSLEGLVCVVGNIAAGLAEAFLRSGHFFDRRIGRTVYTGNSVALFALIQRLGLVGGVDKHLFQIRQLGLFGVAAILHNAGDAVMDRPDLRYRHRHRPPLRGRLSEADLRSP